MNDGNASSSQLPIKFDGEKQQHRLEMQSNKTPQQQNFKSGMKNNGEKCENEEVEENELEGDYSESSEDHEDGQCDENIVSGCGGVGASGENDCSEMEVGRGVGTSNNSSIQVDMTSSKAPKRKNVSNVCNVIMNLLEFMQLVFYITLKMTFDRKVVSAAAVTEFIDAMNVSEFEPNAGVSVLSTTQPQLRGKGVKQVKLNDSSASSPLNRICVPTVLEETQFFETVNQQDRRTVFLTVISCLLPALEDAGIGLGFQREYLKYFLATHRRFVTPNDFSNTNALKKPNRKQKQTHLPNGAILLEYVKQPDLFASNLSRCDQSDVEALKFIVEKRIEISRAIFHSWFRKRFADAKYVNDETDEKREGYICIPVTNLKRTAVLITNTVMLMHDGTQFSLPHASFERDITARMIATAGLLRGEYMILDVLISNKIKVIDLMESTKSDCVIPQEYVARMKLVQDMFKNIKTVVPTMERYEGSYIQKAQYGINVTNYVYYRPYLTVAIVGLYDKTVWLAFKNDAGDLEVKLSTNIAGPVAVIIGTERLCHSPPSTEENTKILLNGKLVRVLELPTSINVRLFRRVIKVELKDGLKDGSKLGSISYNEVSSTHEFKAPVASKETVSEDMLKQFVNNPNNLNSVLEVIIKSPQYNSILRKLQANIVHLEIPLSYS
uniref:Uncharacterized protein n=1 Tax=Venturia canescens TaxID=32260 RepID=A0A0U1ZLV4_9HYME|nr:hypothetical protein [Venturia canescens]